MADRYRGGQLPFRRSNNRDLQPYYAFGRDRLRGADYGWEGYYRQPTWYGNLPERPPANEDLTWLGSGPYSGMGPRDFRRPDDRIFEDVCERLTRDGRLDASDIEVEVEDGEVTLRGTVHDRYEKRRAEDIAEAVFGVRDVHNRLRLQGQSQSARPYPWSGWAEPRLPVGPDQVWVGMAVLGVDGEDIGHAKEVHRDSFLVDRPLARDVYVPYSACRATAGDHVILKIPGDEIEQQGWPTPEMFRG